MKIITVKKRYIFVLIAVMLLAIYIVNTYNKRRVAVPTFLPISNRIITIDPGHGGIDPGAVSIRGTKEDEVNLQIALKLKRLIEQSGGIVVMTREEDIGLYSDEAESLRQMKREDLQKRKEIVEESESEVFISIHLNSFINARYHGAQTFYRDGFKEGEELSLKIQDELKNVLNEDNKRQPQKRDNIYLLNEINIPSTLVECGFLSNSAEDRLLNQDEYQEKIAWSIYTGLLNYFGELELKHQNEDE